MVILFSLYQNILNRIIVVSTILMMFLWHKFNQNVSQLEKISSTSICKSCYFQF